jgi:hypothetical protein
MRVTRRAVRLSGAVCLTCLALGVGAGPASAAPNSFTIGDLVIDQASLAPGQTAPSSNASPISLVDYSTSGVPSGYSVSLPTTDNTVTGNHALTDSGTATYDGEITLSTDGYSVLVPGYDYTPTSTESGSLTSALNVPRTVGVVSATGSVDTTTQLSDSVTEGTTSANNFRSVAGATAAFYSGGQGGSAYETDGGSANYLDSQNVHQVEVFGGQLYESTTTSIIKVGSGLATSGTQTDTAFTLSGAPSKFEPAGFLLLAVGSSTPNTLYVADTGSNAVEEYTGSGTSWTLAGSITVPQVTGIVGAVNGSAVDLYLTGATSTTAKFNSVLYGIVDSNGNSSFSTSTLSTLATAPTGDSFHGLAFAPSPPPSSTPESPWALLLPVTGILIVGGGLLVARRRHQSVLA